MSRRSNDGGCSRKTLLTAARICSVRLRPGHRDVSNACEAVPTVLQVWVESLQPPQKMGDRLQHAGGANVPCRCASARLQYRPPADSAHGVHCAAQDQHGLTNMA
jgi:hypothetical protein